MAQHNQLGKEGEQLVAEHMIRQGFTILERNWRLNHLEVDIIAQKDNALHVVEVKTRREVNHYDPLRSIDRKKISNLVHAANAYIRLNRLRMPVVFDVAVCTGGEGALKLEFMPNAFRAPLRTVGRR